MRLAGWLKALPATFYTVHVRRNRIGQPQYAVPNPNTPSSTPRTAFRIESAAPIAALQQSLVSALPFTRSTNLLRTRIEKY